MQGAINALDLHLNLFNIFYVKLFDKKMYAMKTVIVPVDFSDTSLNAARYATKLFVGHSGDDRKLQERLVMETFYELSRN